MSSFVLKNPLKNTLSSIDTNTAIYSVKELSQLKILEINFAVASKLNLAMEPTGSAYSSVVVQNSENRNVHVNFYECLKDCSLIIKELGLSLSLVHGTISILRQGKLLYRATSSKKAAQILCEHFLTEIPFEELIKISPLNEKIA